MKNRRLAAISLVWDASQHEELWLVLLLLTRGRKDALID